MTNVEGVTGVACDVKMLNNLKLGICKTMIMAVLIYGEETWTVARKSKSP